MKWLGLATGLLWALLFLVGLTLIQGVVDRVGQSSLGQRHHYLLIPAFFAALNLLLATAGRVRFLKNIRRFIVPFSLFSLLPFMFYFTGGM